MQWLHHLHGIQAQIARIGTHKADGVGPTRQFGEIVFLDRRQMILAYLEDAGNRGQIVAPAQAGGAQILSYRFQRRLAIAGNLTQMDAAADAVFIQTHLRDFGHA